MRPAIKEQTVILCGCPAFSARYGRPCMAPFDTGLAPTTAPDVALRHIVAECRADLRKYRGIVLQGRRPVGIHQTRVALRRLRAAFGLFRHAVDGPVVRALSAEAKWLAGECAPARDLHVFLTETVEGVPPVIQRIARRLAETYMQRARSALSGARFEAFDRQLHAFIDLSPVHPAEQLNHFARVELDQHHEKVMYRGRRIDSLDPHHLHRLRIAIKKLRYAAEFLQAAFASKAARPYIESTARLQGTLGAMNDRAVGRHLLADLATAARPSEDAKEPLKRLAKQTEAGEKRRRRKLERAWKAFRKADKFW